MATPYMTAVSSGRGRPKGGSQQPDPDLKLFIRNVLENKKRPLSVRSWSTIKDVKDQLSQKLQVPASSLRLFFGPLLTSGKELPNHRTLQDVGIYRSGETILLDIKNSNNNSTSSTFPTSPFRGNHRSEGSGNTSATGADVQISSSVLPLTPKYLQSLVSQARWGLLYGLKPDLVLDGSGGTYILHDVRKNPIAIFKPSDEEPYAENNPRGYLRPSLLASSSISGDDNDSPLALRAGVAPGEACIREVAAYLLDKDGFAGVPPTTLVEARHATFNTNGSRLNVSQGGASIGPHSIGAQQQQRSAAVSSLVQKPGSFQEFIKCECTIDDISPSKIATMEVHKIAILDLRIMNADRNAANLLVRRRRDNTLELVPIDHGFCLRSVCDVSWMDWCWLDWPQLKEPLCPDHKEYIMSLDVEADARLLREHLNICEEAVDYFRASSALLKAGVAAGLTLYDIAIMCCRNDNLAEIPSMMEKLYDMASDLAHTAVENERWHHSATSRAIEEQLVPSPPTVSWDTAPMMMPVATGSAAAARQRKFGRSVSNAEFTSAANSLLTQALSERSIINEETAPGSEDELGMAHSSVSDSCSEAEEATEVNDACNQWAAELIAKVESRQNLQASVSPVRPVRSASIESFDNSGSVLSTSPMGFWTVPPGSAEHLAGDDNESIQWSPRSVSRASLSGLDGHDDVPFMLDDFCETPTIQRVTFAPDMLVGPLLPFGHPSLVDVINMENDAAAALITASSPEQRVLLAPVGKVIRKSKSYSAMPAAGRPHRASTGNNHRHARGPVDKSTERYAQYKKYFHKFIDLVIVRETTTAAFYVQKNKAAVAATANNNTLKPQSKKHASR